MLIDAGGFVASLAVALTASLHCAGMCGPLAATASGSRARAASATGAPPWRGAARSFALYQAGKLTSYLLLGGLAIWAGAAASRLGPWPARLLSLAGGGLLLAVGLKAAGLLPRRPLGSDGAPAEPTWARRLLRHWLALGASLLALPAPARALLCGAFSGLLPCPLVYAFAARAAAVAPLDGLAVMVALGAGTAPALGAATFLGPGLLHRRLGVARAWGLAVAAVGCWTIIRGWAGLPCCPG